jgi:ATP synthase I chain
MMLDDLPATTLPRLLRRTIWMALIVGTIGFFVAISFDPLAGLGEALGIGVAIINLRFLDKQVARIEVQGEQTSKAIRRQLGGKTLGRLVLATLVVLGALFLSTPLGIGIVSGLVIYQMVFVANLFKIVVGQGRPS